MNEQAKLRFRAFKDKYHIKALKAVKTEVVYKWDYPRWEYIVSYRVNGHLDEFKFYKSYDDYINNRVNVTQEDLFYMLMARLDEAVSYENCPTFCDFCSEFGYDLEDCEESYKTFKALQEANRQVVNAWKDIDQVFNAVNMLQDIENEDL